MSLSRTNKQSYAILSDISGNSVTVSGSSLKVAVTDPLPTGTNTLGAINGVTPGSSTTQLGTVHNGDVSTTNVGVAPLVVQDDGLDGLVDGSYTMLRADASGAQWVRVTGTVTTTGGGSTATVTTQATTLDARSYTDGLVYDGSFTSLDSSCYDISGGTRFSFAGRAQSGGVDASFVLAMYACSGPDHGTPDTETTTGDMMDTGYTLQNLGTGGPFFATFNDLGFPYVSFKNITSEVTGNSTDICLNLFVYSR